MMGFRFMENFNAAVHQPVDHRVLAALAHQPVHLAARLPVHHRWAATATAPWMTYRNLFLTMLLGGLWHGANWTFVVWGRGTAWLAIEEPWRERCTDAAQPDKWALTFLLVVMGWVIFRAENLEVAGRMYGALLPFGEWPLWELNLATSPACKWSPWCWPT